MMYSSYYPAPWSISHMAYRAYQYNPSQHSSLPLGQSECVRRRADVEWNKDAVVRLWERMSGCVMRYPTPVKESFRPVWRVAGCRTALISHEHLEFSCLHSAHTLAVDYALTCKWTHEQTNCSASPKFRGWQTSRSRDLSGWSDRGKSSPTSVAVKLSSFVPREQKPSSSSTEPKFI